MFESVTVKLEAALPVKKSFLLKRKDSAFCTKIEARIKHLVHICVVTLLTIRMELDWMSHRIFISVFSMYKCPTGQTSCSSEFRETLNSEAGDRASDRMAKHG